MGRKPQAHRDAKRRSGAAFVMAVSCLALLQSARAQTEPCNTFPTFGTGELDVTTDFFDAFVSGVCRRRHGARARQL